MNKITATKVIDLIDEIIDEYNCISNPSIDSVTQSKDKMKLNSEELS